MKESNLKLAQKDIDEALKAVEEMELIAGQKPVITRAKKSVANFKLREGMAIDPRTHTFFLLLM